MILVFGSINVDLVCRVARLPRPGETLPGSDYELIPGGKGANQALAARRAGAQVRLIGAVGEDDMAAIACAELAAGGVELTGVARLGRSTGLAIITVDDEAENTIVLSPGANARVTAGQMDNHGIGPQDTLLLQMEIPFEQSLAAARIAKAAGARVILSIAPFLPIDRDAFDVVDIVLVNETEAGDLARHLGLPIGADGAATVATLAAALGRTVVATLGAAGAVAADQGVVVKVPSIKIKPVDTTGAGDTFCGVLAALIDEGRDLATALAHASAAGALACLKLGAQPSFPLRTEIDKAVGQPSFP